jgi:hypothetical protein
LMMMSDAMCHHINHQRDPKNHQPFPFFFSYCINEER